MPNPGEDAIDRNGAAQALADQAKKHFEHFLFIGWEPSGKWVCTVNPGFDKTHMTYLRDWLTRQIDDDGS